MRRRLGRAFILGFEYLIAGDIIKIVVVTRMLESAAILVIIVLIRAFLSFTLEHSIEGRRPWKKEDGKKSHSEAVIDVLPE